MPITSLPRLWAPQLAPSACIRLQAPQLAPRACSARLAPDLPPLFSRASARAIPPSAPSIPSYTPTALLPRSWSPQQAPCAHSARFGTGPAPRFLRVFPPPRFTQEHHHYLQTPPPHICLVFGLAAGSMRSQRAFFSLVLSAHPPIKGQINIVVLFCCPRQVLPMYTGSS
ncbi:hypothetical protein B0H19DRAFT_1085160 [Mycena capillaripes]|nr:hypothetical protein B0H19DRAFT_1085160 [Mycena capillaripes]